MPKDKIGSKPSRAAMKQHGLGGKRKDWRYAGQQRVEYVAGSGSKEEKMAQRRGLGADIEKGRGAAFVGPQYDRVTKPIKLKQREAVYGGSQKDKSGSGTKGVTKKRVGKRIK